MLRNMKNLMMMRKLFLISLFAFLEIFAISAQARTLPESPRNQFAMKSNYERPSSPPPPSPTSSPPSHPMTSTSPCIAQNPCNRFIGMTGYGGKSLSLLTITNYERPSSPPPPAPKPSTPIGQITSASPCGAKNSCDGLIITMTDYRKTLSPLTMTNYERPSMSPPPPPQSSTPIGQITSASPCVVGSRCNRFTMMADYERTPSSPPPSPNPATPIVQITRASPCAAGSPCNMFVITTTDYERASSPPPPSPNPSPASREITNLEQLISKISPANPNLASS